MTIPLITNVDRLKYNLNMGAGYDGYSALMDAIRFSDEELEKLCIWNPDHHTRIALYDCDELEVLLTCWEPGQASAVHNYNLSQGWIRVLKGKLYLELFHIKDGKPMETSATALHDKGSFYLNDGMGYHRFSNPSSERAVALIFYAAKVKEWDALDEESGHFTTVKTSYDLNLDTD